MPLNWDDLRAAYPEKFRPLLFRPEGVKILQAAAQQGVIDKVMWGASTPLNDTSVPDAIGEQVYYEPTTRGMEAKLKDKLDALRDARQHARKAKR